MIEELSNGNPFSCVQESNAVLETSGKSLDPDASVPETLEETTTDTAATRRRLMMTRRRLREGASFVVLQARRSVHAGADRRSHLGSHRNIVSTPHEAKRGHARNGLKEGPQTTRREESARVAKQAVPESGRKRTVIFDTGALEAASEVEAAQPAANEAIETNEAVDAAPSPWKTWRPANTADTPLPMSARIPMPRQLPAPTEADGGTAAMDGTDFVRSPRLRDVQEYNTPDAEATRPPLRSATTEGASHTVDAPTPSVAAADDPESRKSRRLMNRHSTRLCA